MKSASFFLLFVAGLSSAAQAQSSTQDELLKRGELTGSRPSARAAAGPAVRRQPASDPVQQHFLNSDVNLAQTSAYQLPDLYERFIATTRDERRGWNAQQWEAAAQVLARLNQRYEQVRTDLPLEERLRVRSFQGEFHALRGARNVQEKLD
ncbi:hypothetical protein MUN81_17030 [Hymenobacter sp. 5317J-9]|uniref:hypothetical protein n=1 Tax=Hymenobacter sp. 5317J-9 TaxID=2932250 RepID=UPI001FD65FAA|nr:hypothetical protein [Hymenobacter sp. 5317J-9]UOQ96935.1 hypothetical protein MUN81_17030 [Hymenobacter sp. 5317J-9]